jgi:hypothetical protein
MVTVVITIMVAIVATVPAIADWQNRKVGAASAIDPHLVTARTPRAAFTAARIASLPQQTNAPVRSHVAVVAAHVIGRARHSASAAGIRIIVPTATPRHHFEIGTASAVDPDLVSAHTPGASLRTASVASLADHSNTAILADLAIVASHIVRRAGNHRLGETRAGQQQQKKTKRDENDSARHGCPPFSLQIRIFGNGTV